VLVSFPIDIPLPEVLRQPVSYAFRFGAVGESTINSKCAINWQHIHWLSPDGWVDKSQDVQSFRKIDSRQDVIPDAFGRLHPAFAYRLTLPPERKVNFSMVTKESTPNSNGCDLFGGSVPNPGPRPGT
jgi:hypothetical protein